MAVIPHRRHRVLTEHRVTIARRSVNAAVLPELAAVLLQREDDGVRPSVVGTTS